MGFLLALGFLYRTGSLVFGNDGYQYLSVATNVLHGRGAETSIIYFDAERKHGVIPAPLTTFPPVYPFGMAVLGFVGLPADSAGAAISRVCFAVLPLALALVVPGGCGRWAFRTVMLLLLLNVPLLATANAVFSEALFSTVMLLACACFARCLTPANSHPAWEICGWMLIGFLYWIRYAGLFILAGILVFFGLRFLLRPCWRTLRPILWSCAASGLIFAAMFRNVALTGSWKGGVARRAAFSGPISLRPLATALYHVVLGDPKAEFGIPALVLAAGIVGLSVLSWRYRRVAKAKSSLEPEPVYWLLGTTVTVYCAAMVYADMTMVISFGPRYFVPLVPLLLLLVLRLLTSAERRANAKTGAYFACCGLLLAGYLCFQIRALKAYSPNVPHQRVLDEFHQRSENGDLMAWVDANIAPNAVITATDGQATAYALRRPTISLSDPPFTDTVWDQRNTLEQMERYGSKYLILYSGAPASVVPAQEVSPFLKGLLSGDVPGGFVLAARNSAVLIFRRIS